MTVEELMKDRYKVKAHYPNSCFAIGEIYTLKEIDFGIGSLPENYPAIFEKLEWWEDRDRFDMPDYVKTTYNGTVNCVHLYDFDSDEIYVHYDQHTQPCQFTLSAYLSGRVPATEEEFNNYIKQNND